MKVFNLFKNLIRYTENKINDYVASTWTPTFGWSNEGVGPTVANISCNVKKIGPLYCFGGRFQITDLGSQPSNSTMTITTPFQVKNGGVATIGELFPQSGMNLTSQLLFRTSSDGQIFYIVDGAGAGYSASKLKTGYYSFSFFWIKA